MICQGILPSTIDSKYTNTWTFATFSDELFTENTIGIRIDFNNFLEANSTTVPMTSAIAAQLVTTNSLEFDACYRKLQIIEHQSLALS